jgi:penicillin-binding protein 1A
LRAATIGGSVALSLFAVALLVYVARILDDLPKPGDVWEQTGTPSITFLDRNGDILMTRGARYGSLIPLAELPDHLVNAFLATEDRRFYSHYGIDFRGLARAMVANYEAGRFVQGGSTLTQQLAKNLFLTSDRTIDRKIREMSLAFWLEANLTKEDILTLYLNRIYLGSGNYGVEAASKFYFGKSVRDINVAEAAVLAALPQAPSRYAPTNSLERAHRRASVVLDNLVTAGYMTEGEVFAARVRPATLTLTEAGGASNYFVDWVTEELALQVGRPEVNLIVKTTYDPNYQTKAELALLTVLENERERLNIGQAAIVSLDMDGGVRAMVGGLSYNSSQFNRATQAKRQPGSAFKPFVYLAALESGMNPNTVMDDAPLTVDKWSPQNSTGTYRGPVTLANALEKSINTVAVRVSETVGREQVIEAAQRLGITSELLPNPSIALGTSEVSLTELTSAYAPFANGGRAVDRHGILDVRIQDGPTLYTYEPPLAHRVVEFQHTVNMTYMLHRVMASGTGQRARLTDRAAAGKTGTSQDFRDAWFVGYTPNLITGVWVGNDDGEPMNRVGGGSVPARIWKEFMDRAHYGTAVAHLPGTDRPVAVASSNPRNRSFYVGLSRQFERAAAGNDPSRRDRRWWPF